MVQGAGEPPPSLAALPAPPHGDGDKLVQKTGVQKGRVFWGLATFLFPQRRKALIFLISLRTVVVYRWTGAEGGEPAPGWRSRLPGRRPPELSSGWRGHAMALGLAAS